MKQISLILILALLVTLAACGKQAPALPTEQETVASEPQTLPEAETFSVKPQTLKGYALTPDGDSVPVQLTMQVEDVRKGEEAEKIIGDSGVELPEPPEGKEYIYILLNVNYDDGEMDPFFFYENYPASWAEARVHFNVPGDSGNNEDVTSLLQNPIWGSTPDSYGIYSRELTVGGNFSGEIAFLQDVGNTQPLIFEGYGQVLKFAIQ